MVEGALDFGVSLDLTTKKDLVFAKQRASSYNQETLLHLFIKQEFISHYYHFFNRMTESVCNEVIKLEFLEEQFNYYDVAIDFLKIKHDEDNNPISTNSQIIKWYNRNKNKFIILSEKIYNEIFFIIFSNRKLLHKFNENIASSFDNFNFDKSQLSIKGTLKRKNVPVWLQRAVFHRDKGRCSFCWKDVGDLVNLDTRKNFDHIIPLDLFGVNDPTNIQLVCKECNLKKLNRNTDVGTKYQEWFL